MPIRRQDRGNGRVELAWPRHPVEELALPTGDGGIPGGDADQGVGAGRTGGVGIPAVFEQLLRQLWLPHVVDEGGIVVNALIAGERGRIGLWASRRVLRPEPQLGEGGGVACV